MLKSLDLESLGLSNRRTRTTSINMESSCSHSVFTCVIESKCKEGQGLNCSEYLQADLLDILKRGERHSGLVKIHLFVSKIGFFCIRS
ncbi:putative P-loop containing nucleoside triphosphate hydrolase, kinesin motor domain superfamily [Helianthus annuus]|nr:putative P-loop containing nucleoside triphosphate hydrolase, kinesin motor domain superfamily [Helianthus annuus]